MQCRLTIFSFELSLKVFPDVQDKVPNHDEWKSQEQSQSSPHLSKERLERIDQNLLMDLHITSRVGEAKNGVVSVMCFTIEKILELFKQIVLSQAFTHLTPDIFRVSARHLATSLPELRSS